MSTTTPNLGLTLPTPNVDTGWGSTLNTDFTLLDNIFADNGSGTAVGINVGSGKTMTLGGSLILGTGDGTGTTAAPTIRGAARTGTNAVGGDITIDAMNGTGSGGSGSIKFRTAPPGTSGASADTMATALEIKPSGDVEVGGRAVNYFMPAGSLMAYAGSSTPTGWLLCFGQAVSRSTYAALFAAIGTVYGTGDGSTTFNVPDFRGRIPAGKDNMGGSAASRLTTAGSGVDGATLGAAGGLQTHILTIAEMPLHGHPFRASYASQGSASANTTGGFMVNVASASTQAAYTGTPSNTQGQQIGGTGGGGAHNNVQPTIVTNWIIKT